MAPNPIDLQYNFPLLPGQDKLWADHLRSSIAAEADLGLPALRTSFRAGDEDLRSIAATWLHQPADRLTLTCGGHHGCFAALLAAALPSKRVAVEAFTYTGFLSQCSMLGIETLPCAMDAQGLLPDALHALCQREHDLGRPISALFTMPTLHNPVGSVASLERRQAIVAVARHFNLLLLEDDAYGFLHNAPPPIYAILAPERAFYIRGLSKNFAPAVRTGFLIAPDLYVAAAATAVKQTSTGVSRVHARAACALIADGTMDATIAAKRLAGASLSAAALALLADFPIQHGTNAWHLWITLPTGLTSQAAESLAEQLGVLVSGSHWFTSPNSPPQPPSVRLGLGGETDPARALEGVRIFASLLHEHQ
ncbi:MAG: PLP-dependent aminotransferase family protein [Acidobacteria bacterium]|nr:PLP-dependent aminotransferase family protein [Acidobacteriota bacterium]